MRLELSQPLRSQHCRQTLPVDFHLLLLSVRLYSRPGM